MKTTNHYLFEELGFALHCFVQGSSAVGQSLQTPWGTLRRVWLEAEEGKPFTAYSFTAPVGAWSATEMTAVAGHAGLKVLDFNNFGRVTEWLFGSPPQPCVPDDDYDPFYDGQDPQEVQ